MKPVSAGLAADGSANPDVAALVAAGNVDAPLADRNPYAFAPAIAPHLAAAQAGVTIDLAVIAAAYARLAAQSDVVVVEGAGGVLVPVDATHDMLDVAARLRLPVLLVVGMRLGCLNHALLSAAAIRARGLDLAGWVANCIDPQMQAVAANVEALSLRLQAPPARRNRVGRAARPVARVPGQVVRVTFVEATRATAQSRRYSPPRGVAAAAGSVLASRAFVAVLPRPAPLPTEAHVRAIRATRRRATNPEI